MLTTTVDLIGFNTYRISATADHVHFPRCDNDLRQCLEHLHPDFTHQIIGGGSNIILSRPHYHHPVVLLAAYNRFADAGKDCIVAGAGVPLAAVVDLAAAHGLWGVEKLAGIPGSFGGALYMNAGAYGQDIGAHVAWVEAIDRRDGTCRRYARQDLTFGYRRSCFMTRSEIISKAKLALTPGGAGAVEEIRAISADILRTRLAKIPYHEPNAGSVFKRPDADMPVGAMLERLGFKGHCINGAMVSRMHCGIIVNTGLARGSDVLRLAETLRTALHADFGVTAELEQVAI